MPHKKTSGSKGFFRFLVRTRCSTMGRWGNRGRGKGSPLGQQGREAVFSYLGKLGSRDYTGSGTRLETSKPVLQRPTSSSRASLSRTAPPSGDQVCKQMSPWHAFYIQTVMHEVLCGWVDTHGCTLGSLSQLRVTAFKSPAASLP